MIINRFCAPVVARCVLFGAALLSGLFAGFNSRAQDSNSAEPEGSAYLNFIKPLPQSLPVNREKALLGQQLFHDSGLGAGRASCGTCHSVELWGSDGLKKSIDVRGGFDDMNTLTVFNAVFNFRLMWNGAVDDLHGQVDAVVNNDRHMGAGWTVALQYVRSKNDYQQQFKKLYGGVIDKSSITDAIVQYERTLITPNAPFDRFLRGDNNAINEQQKQGLKLFIDYGCIACHQGINVGGNMFARFGVFVEPYKTVVATNEFDLGRFNVTGVESDRFVMRVPSLRNVAKTGPYFHSGSTARLQDAIKTMGYYQLGRKIPDEEAELIARFLESLTGEKPEPLQ
ncbi:cytochrome-c peroxidase [Porticoccus sp. GXU_MW_L64]